MLPTLSVSLAQAAGPAEAPVWATPLLIGVVFVIFYMLVIRPQQKRQKQHQALLNAIGVGDRVVTVGGLVGKVTKADNISLTLRIAPSVDVSVLRQYVAGKAPEENS